MATWVAGKLTRPAIRSALGYMQDKHPDSAITASIARIATATDPLAPSDEPPLAQAAGDSARAAGLPPEEKEAEAAPGQPAQRRRSLRSRAQGAVVGRSKTWVLGKAQSVIWQQICLPLTGVLWLISFLLSWFEGRATASAQVTKEASTHERDVARVLTAIKARAEGAVIAIKPSSKHVAHVLRTENGQRLGPAAALAQRSAASSSSSPPPRPPVHAVDLSKLTRMLSLDAEQKTCVVEARMTFRDLVRATTAHHLMPPVVPPFPEQTVGGAFIGGAISSTSGGYGSFAATVVQVEVILGNGELVTAGRQGPRADLFHALAGSYHSLGTVVSLTLELVPAPRYVQLSFEVHRSMDKAMPRLQALLDKRESGGLIGVEGLVFAADSVTLVSCRGIEHIDTSKHKVLGFARWWEQPFAAYVRHWTTLLQSRSVSAMPTKHCLPLTDYLWRYDTNSFWLADWVAHLLPWPMCGNTFISRLLVGWALNDANLRSTFAHDREMQLKLGQLRVVQDAHIPLAHVARFVGWELEAIGVAPLWLCPVLANPSNLLEASLQHPAASAPTPPSRSLYYVNVGVYGRPAHGSSSVSYSGEDVNEELVEQVYKAGGRTMLHAHNWHTQQLLRQMYDTQRYEAMRERYGAEQTYEHLYSRVTLQEADRSEMRKPFQQPELPLLRKAARQIVKHKIGIA